MPSAFDPMYCAASVRHHKQRDAMSTPQIHSVRVESSGCVGKPPRRRSADSVARIAMAASVLFSGLFAGFLTTVFVLEASLRRFPAPVYTQVRLVELVHLDDLATVLLPAALLATATLVLATIGRPGPTRWLVLAALGLLVVTFIISALVSVPINTEQQGWSVLAPPGDWASVRDRWQIAHLVRTSTAVCAFTILVAAAITRRPALWRDPRR
jgi:uncharacterized membrane protein